MHFVSLRSFREAFHISSDLSDLGEKKRVIDQLRAQKENGKIAIGKWDYSVEFLIDFIQNLDAKNIVFLDWIDHHKDLSALLNNELPTTIFNDTQNWKKHSLLSEFKNFISPFLQQSLISFGNELPIEKLMILFSYTSLLPADDQMLIEQILFKPIQQNISDSKEQIATSVNETELLKSLQEACNDSVIEIINYLSRSSYSTKLWYLDQMLWVIQQKGCTVRLANWILKQIEKIQLNPEHEQKITELKRDLKEGKIKTKNTLIHSKNRWSFPFVLLRLFILGFVILIAWIIVKKPFSNVDDGHNEMSTSYEQFTKAERKKIDSLLREIQQAHPKDDSQIDPYNSPIPGNGVSLSLRSSLKNDRMEQLYKDLLTDADLHEQGLMDSCSVFSSKAAKNQMYSGVKKATARNGNEAILFKNESAYAVYFFAFTNEKGGNIYSQLIEKGKTIELKFNENDHFLFVAGNDLGKFIPPKKATELPSITFDHHFCDVDVNYTESLSVIYKLARPRSGKNKLLFTGDKNGYFSVIDLYGVLEED